MPEASPQPTAEATPQAATETAPVEESQPQVQEQGIEETQEISQETTTAQAGQDQFPEQGRSTDPEINALSEDPLAGAQAQEEGKDEPQITNKTFRFTTKIDGEEQEVELDADTVRRDYQKWKAADKRFQESAQMRKQNLDFIDRLKDPNKLPQVLEAIGYNVREMAEQYLYTQLQYDSMTPEQKRAFQAEQELAAIKARDKASADRLQQETQHAESQRMAKQLQGEVIEALKKNHVPQTARTVKRMAEIKKIHIKRGIDIDWNEAAKIVEREKKQSDREYYKNLDAGKLQEVLGEELGKKIREHDLSKIKNPIQTKAKLTPQQKQPLPKRGYLTEKDIEAHLNRVKASKK